MLATDSEWGVCVQEAQSQQYHHPVKDISKLHVFEKSNSF